MGERSDDTPAAEAAGSSDPDDSPGPQAGSQSAAQSATPPGAGRGGLFGRLLGALGANAPARDAPEESAPTPFAPPLPGIGNLRKMRVDDVSIPKVEIVAVPVTTALPDLVAAFRASGFSRLPVFKGTLDNPLGLIHMKDLALQHAFADPKPRFNLRKLLRPLLYAPPSMPIGVLLRKMQAERIHMALVIDEYGGVDGLVTLEDLVEQVIGEIDDEHDEAEAGLWTLEKPGQYLAQARAPLSDFEAEIGQKLSEPEDEDEIDTLGGLVFMLSGRVPARGEVIRAEDGTEFEIVDADPRRIKRLRVRLPQPAA